MHTSRNPTGVRDVQASRKAGTRAGDLATQRRGLHSGPRKMERKCACSALPKPQTYVK